MASTETNDHQALLEAGVDIWNEWRQAHPDYCPDLSQAYLFEAKLQGANLKGVNLTRACLIGANLTAADLSQADLQDAYMSKAELRRANLTEANLARADCSEAILIAADLTRANVSGTNLEGCFLTGACLQEWQISDQTNLENLVCDYIYQQQTPAVRYPESGDLAPGDLARWLGRKRSTPQPQQQQGQRVFPKVSLGSAQHLLWLGLLGASGALGLVIMGVVIGRHGRPSADPAPTPPEVIATASLPCPVMDLPAIPDREADYTYASGTRFYGSLGDDGPADGSGLMVFANGDRYDGNFEDGLRSGCGTLTFADGQQYVGQFADDRFNGIGQWIGLAGERYVGQFQDNNCEGWGTWVAADGSARSGVWQQNTLVGDTLTCKPNEK